MARMGRASLASFVFGCLVALAASVLPDPSSARACSGPACAKTALLPPDGGSVPENSVELIWRPSVVFAGDARTELHLYELDGGTRRELAFGLTAVPGDDAGSLQKIIPRERLAAGTELLVEAEEVCESEGARASSSLRVGPAAPAPSSLGTLEIEAMGYPLELRVQSGECFRPHSVASVRVRVVLSESARPYADLLRYEMHVDGAPYTTEEAQPNWREQPPRQIGASVLGRGVDRIYCVCETPPPFAFTPLPTGFSQGTHRVQMFGFMPDGSRLASDEIQIYLRCPTPVDYWPGDARASDPGAGADAAVGAGEPASSSDAAPSSGAAADTAADAAALGGSAVDASFAADPRPRSSGAAQCSPRIGTRTGRPLLCVLFLLLISIVGGRTRRRLHALGSARQSGRNMGAQPPPRV
jgi:hypothetical protein